MALESARFGLLTQLAAAGRYHFTTTDAAKALGGSSAAVRATLRRAKERGEIADPYRGFHLIVPPEYRQLGCLPAEQFVPQLMEHLGETYYVALLSAAELHGAAHHRPQRFQVMVAKNRRELVCGQVRVEFIARGDLERTPTVEMNTPRGRMRVASPEATALELAGYADRCGGLDNVATVLGELADAIDAPKLAAAGRLGPITWVQRLGYLLERTEQPELADALDDDVRDRALTLARLTRARSTTGEPRNERWKLVVNAVVEAET